MATISDSLGPTYLQPHLRQFDAQRDLGPVADLIELCFAETLDPDGRRYLERMRSLAAHPRPLLWVNSAAEWNSTPLFGYVWQEDNRVVIAAVPGERVNFLEHAHRFRIPGPPQVVSQVSKLLDAVR